MAAMGTPAADSDAMKNRRRTTTKTKRPSAPKVSLRSKPSSTNADTKIALLKRERDEALEQFSAASEILKVISSSPGDLKPVFEAILEKATRICGAKFGVLQLYEDGAFRIGAMHNAPPSFAEVRQREPVIRPAPSSPLGRLIDTKRLAHIADLAADNAYKRDPIGARFLKSTEARTILVVPMLRENALVGEFSVYRQEVSPFSDKQIALVQNFAAQAVIAIENTRLLNELRESLEQQTATSEVLSVISSSPGELEPVFQAMLANAMRICEAKFGILYAFTNGQFRAISWVGVPSRYADFVKQSRVWGPETGLGQIVQTREVVHIRDVVESRAYSEGDDPGRVATVDLGGVRTAVIVPMLKESELVGAFVIYRQEVRPFTDKQIALVQNFAAQAVIAIENTRLLNELRQRTDDLTESLEQQTATSEVLRVISTSPGELEPVFQAILENATRICGAKFGTLGLYDGGQFRNMALYNVPAGYADVRFREPFRPHSKAGLAQVARTKQMVHIDDLRTQPAYLEGDPAVTAMADLAGARTILIMPMLKEGRLVGAVSIYCQEVRPFSDRQIALVQNFAAQAVIAIENTRLLNELRESLEQQTATSEVLSVISSSPGELEPVFQTMLESATRICDAKFGNFLLHDGNVFHVRAMYNAPPAWNEYRQRNPSVHPGPNHPLARMAATKQFQHITDSKADVSYLERDPALVPMVDLTGARTALVVPMLKDDVLVGAIVIYRQEVRPFTDKQIALVENFAAQAVIAIENTRLLNELRQSLQQQTATSDVLKVISRSTFDLQTVLDTLVKSAAQLCEVRTSKHCSARSRRNVLCCGNPWIVAGA